MIPFKVIDSIHPFFSLQGNLITHNNDLEFYEGDIQIVVGFSCIQVI